MRNPETNEMLSVPLVSMKPTIWKPSRKSLTLTTLSFQNLSPHHQQNGVVWEEAIHCHYLPGKGNEQKVYPTDFQGSCLRKCLSCLYPSTSCNGVPSQGSLKTKMSTLYQSLRYQRQVLGRDLQPRLNKATEKIHYWRQTPEEKCKQKPVNLLSKITRISPQGCTPRKVLRGLQNLYPGCVVKLFLV